MTHEYNSSIAKHYAAFRPALHKLILRRLIQPNEHFKIGLDIGCGTGYSTIELEQYCDIVFGLDPNQSMLDQAILHPKISYFQGNGNNINIPGYDHFDIVTFAGSLSYAKTDKLKSELIRTLSPNGLILVYDFQIFLNDLMTSIGMNISIPLVDNYNHRENISDWTEFSSDIIDNDIIQLKLSVQEVTHILLANSYLYKEFQKRFQEIEPFNCMKNYIKKHNSEIKLKTEIYFSRYHMPSPMR